MITITETTIDKFHHMPEYQKPVELKGLTVRQALKALRGMDFGSIGGMYYVDLSDNTMLSVELGGGLMSSQHARRSERYGRTIRKYRL